MPMEFSSVRANVRHSTTDWNAIDWKQSHRIVRNLRQRIFKAAAAGDLKRVGSLQKLLLSSHANRAVSVRRVTQLNRGKNTPGVDRVTVKTPTERGRLVDALRSYTPWRVRPTRRIYIPKRKGRRPLGIPTAIDRAMQAVVKNALEPFWEARFEPCSYGFRPGRSAHDAIERIRHIVKPSATKKWVLKADIQGAFDQISHAHLVRVIRGFPGSTFIERWLEAGYVEGGQFHPTKQGTPQGGVISPLLLNVALHGMEAHLGVRYRRSQGRLRGVRAKRVVVRFADDMVVFCQSEADAGAAREELVAWLAQRGLSLSQEKTRIVHLDEGFDFLGFTIGHYRSSKTKTGRKLLIRPSQASRRAVVAKLRQAWAGLHGQSMHVVLTTINPIIRGQAHYYRFASSSQFFCWLDTYQYEKQARWAKRRHPNKSGHWRRRRYWGRFNAKRPGDSWVFGDRDSSRYMLKYKWHTIVRHIPVRGDCSPDNPEDRSYWRRRALRQGKLWSPYERRVAWRQQWTCPVCGQYLTNGEPLEKDHRVPLSQGGTDQLSNVQLLHYYCHMQKTARDRRARLLPGRSSGPRDTLLEPDAW